ncbi:MAG: ABC transporter permease [Acholeplasmatales bacterium]
MFKIVPLNKEKRLKGNKPNVATILGIPYYVILLGLIIIPVVLIVFYAITIKVNELYYRFTFEYFVMFFKEPIFLKTLGDSLFLAVITTIITLIIGYPIAYVIAKRSPKTQALLILLVTAPMWINMLIRVLAWKQIFDMIDTSLLGSNTAIIVGMVYAYLPFMVLPIYTVISKIDPLLYEASADLGANNFKTFLKVTLPLSVGGILSGVTMVLLPAATTIVIPKILGNGKYLIGSLIEDRFLKAGNWGYGSAIAIILSLIIMAMVYITKKADKNKEVEKFEDF